MLTALPAGLDQAQLVALMRVDKKAVSGLSFVLDSDGGPQLVTDVSAQVVRRWRASSALALHHGRGLRQEHIMIRKLTPNLMVADVDASTAFYGQFGFHRVMRVPKEGDPAAFAILVAGGAELMLQSRTSIEEDLPPHAETLNGGGAIMYLTVDDIHGLYDKLADSLDVIVDMRRTFYGSDEFYIRDLD